MTMTKILLVSALAGCGAYDGGRDAESTAVAITTTGVKDMPAVNRGLYPDSIGYLYVGDGATVVWMQNTFTAPSRAALEDQLHGAMSRGLSAEFIASRMQHVEPITEAQPSLGTVAGRAAQAVRLMSQYAFTAQDYAGSLGGALATYNADPARLQAISDASARIDAALTSVGTVSQGNPLPAPPPPAHRGPVLPGRYFAAAVVDGQRGYLDARAGALQRAITNRDPLAYAAAFSDVFYAQSDPELRDRARAALGISHGDGLLTGHPLDAVIAQYVLQAPVLDLALTMDQLRLINQINLAANQLAASRQPLVAALLLLDEDRRSGETDALLSCAAIWAHVHDLGWLVEQYVRVRANGTTAQDTLNLINIIVSNAAL